MLTFPQYSKSNTYWATSIFIKYSEVIWKSKKFLFDRLFLLFWHFYGIKRSSYGRRLWPLIAYLWLHEKCLYAEFYRSGFSRIQTEYKDFVCKFAYSIQMRETADPKNSEYRQFLRLYFELPSLKIYLTLHEWSSVYTHIMISDSYLISNNDSLSILLYTQIIFVLKLDNDYVKSRNLITISSM